MEPSPQTPRLLAEPELREGGGDHGGAPCDSDGQPRGCTSCACGRTAREGVQSTEGLGVRRTSWCGVAERGGARAAEAAQG
jgi:hypothetical protein